ncbi:5755_t:CDS:1, partial [Racocetra persica]
TDKQSLEVDKIAKNSKYCTKHLDHHKYTSKPINMQGISKALLKIALAALQ